MDYGKLEKMLEAFPKQSGDCVQLEYLQLEPILFEVSRTGAVRFPWQLMKPLIRYKLEAVLTEQSSGAAKPDGVASSKDGSDQIRTKELLERFDKFTGPPFTVQRMCELLVEPRRWYSRKGPLLHGLEKTLLVSTTVEPDLSWKSKQTELVSEEGKERLVHGNDTSADDDEGSAVLNDLDQTNRGLKRSPSVELSEADSTISNGFESGSSPPPSKKACLEDRTTTPGELQTTDSGSPTTTDHTAASNTLPED